MTRPEPFKLLDGEYVTKPWGDYVILDEGERFKVKAIRVVPGGKLSLQFHHHRAEDWVIVSGAGIATFGNGSENLLTEGMHMHIPQGAVHRIENRGKIPLEFIEVQVGEYLGEDDIVRLVDYYGRADGVGVTQPDQLEAQPDQNDNAEEQPQ
jgi:mannose-6-phosphate isomerase-like protein (cupin superfamily)